MKKYIGLLILGLSLSCPVWAEWTAENCTKRGGRILQNGDYCASTQTMNWWSAHAWCKSHEGHLASILEACLFATNTEGTTCPNAVYGYGAYSSWLNDSTSEGKCWIVDPNGNTGPFPLKLKSPTELYKALCK